MRIPRYSVIVIGAGGTGTYFLKEFSRFLSGKPSGETRVSSLTVFDGDTVEEKNLERQAFTEDDLGQNKAAVMADVLNSAFGLDWRASGEYLLNTSQLKDAVKYDTVPVIVGCVDNHSCRLVIEKYFSSVRDCFYLDSANEFTTGEVVFSYRAENRTVSPCRSHYFPKIREKAKARNEMSCEELNNVAPQHIATNMCAGNILLTEICSILKNTPHPGIVTFDTASFSQEYVPYKGVA